MILLSVLFISTTSVSFPSSYCALLALVTKRYIHVTVLLLLLHRKRVRFK
jgi:hypothetical protein